MAGDSSGPRIRSRSSSFVSRRERLNASPRFRPRWRAGFDRAASHPDVLTRRWLIAAALGVALLLLLGKALAGVYVDYRWFAALGAESVWWARVENLLILRGLSGAVATIFFFCNLYAVRHSVVSLVLPRRVANIEIGEEVPSRYLFLAVIGMSLVFGILLAFPQDDWTSLALVRWGQPFREADPYFEYDLGFWTY